MQKITPFLWFNGNLEEAVDFYTSVFKNSTIKEIHRLGEGGPGTGTIELAGQKLMALDGGPMFNFTPATSFFVNCETEDEINEIWEKLGEGGMVFMPLTEYPFSKKFGWVQDKFGISWQLNLTGSAQKITPFLMFVKEQAGKAEEAMNFYTSLFKNSEILRSMKFGPGEQGAEGTIKHAAFMLDGQEFMAMDSTAEHNFTFSPAISFFVNCESQEEVDTLWEKLSEGGAKSRCGWLADKYGLSWQIIPTELGKYLSDPDPAKAKRVMDAMLKMDKIDIQKLKEAYGQN